MKLEDFRSKYNLSASNKFFIDNVWEPLRGEYGLSKIYPEVEFIIESDEIEDDQKRYFIDFIIQGNKTYFIEIDDSSHYTDKFAEDAHDAYGKSQDKKIDVDNALAIQNFECVKNKFGDKIEIDKGKLYPSLISIPFKAWVMDDPFKAKKKLQQIFLPDPYMNVQYASAIEHKIKPTEPQKITLDKIAQARKENKNGVISLTTAIGKTFIAILDAKENAKNVLFVAHVEDIINDAENSFRRAWPEIEDQVGRVTGKQKNYNKKVILSTIQTLHRDNNLFRFEKDYFDTIIVDETHHSAAKSYEKILKYFKPRFLLGLTGTHERHDKAEYLQYYDNNIIHEITREEAQDNGWIVPFKYIGCKDDVDYSDIRWNGSRYDQDDLNKKLIIEKRDKAILEEFQKQANNDFKKNNNGKDILTIGFCCSIEHAENMADYFSTNGVSAKAIHSNTRFLSRETRQKITKAFSEGEERVIFTVDAFNEGVDFPAVECLLFIRETQSQVIRKQQLGRGLRPSEDKEKVIVLDFIGNDKNFKGRFGAFGFDPDDMPTGKEIYEFDNNGNEVVFTQEVYEHYQRIDNIFNKYEKPNLDKIPSDWREYSEFINNEIAEGKYYWYIGKHIKNIPLLMEAINILKNSPDITDEIFKVEFASCLKNYHGGNNIKETNSGFRSLFFAKALGLVTGKGRRRSKPLIPTEAFNAIANKVDNQFDNVSLYIDEIQEQLEKMLYYMDLYDKDNVKSEVRTDKSIFNVYYFMIIYKILLILEERDGDASISFEEFQFFIVFIRSYDECAEVADRIIELRYHENKYDIYRLLRKSTEDLRGEERLSSNPGILHYSKYLKVKDKEKISLNKKLINKVYYLIINYEKLLAEGKIPFGNDERYREMLENPGTPWQD